MLFTSEQVSAGHPDKICDQIADAIVTDCLRHDRDSRVAVECMIKDCMIFIAGEITSTHAPDYEVLCREVLRRVGDPDPEAYVVNSLVTCQSRDIAMGVDRGGRWRPRADVRLRDQRDAGDAAAALRCGHPCAGAAARPPFAAAAS